MAESLIANTHPSNKADSLLTSPSPLSDDPFFVCCTRVDAAFWASNSITFMSHFLASGFFFLDDFSKHACNASAFVLTSQCSRKVKEDHFKRCQNDDWTKQ